MLVAIGLDAQEGSLEWRQWGGPNGNFVAFQKILTGVISRIVEIGARDQRLAAE